MEVKGAGLTDSNAGTPLSLPIVNIAAYRFAALVELPALRIELLALCRSQLLRGTILLSSEGVNLFVAGGSPPFLSRPWYCTFDLEDPAQFYNWLFAPGW